MPDRQSHHAAADSQARSRQDARPPRADLLAFDPYSPAFPSGAPESKRSDPLALDPYSPIFPRRVRAR
jgi:hypothetical protein